VKVRQLIYSAIPSCAQLAARVVIAKQNLRERPPLLLPERKTT
jgi:hypothetical protein